MPALPSGWKLVEEKGKTPYYWNTETQEVTWTPPTPRATRQSRSDSGAPPPVPTRASKGGKGAPTAAHNPGTDLSDVTLRDQSYQARAAGLFRRPPRA